MEFNAGEKVYCVYNQKVHSCTIEGKGYDRNEVTGDKNPFPSYCISIRDKDDNVEAYSADFLGAIFTTEKDAFRCLQDSKIRGAVRLLKVKEPEDALALLMDYLDAENPISDPIPF
jgi:hypothetical protein